MKKVLASLGLVLVSVAAAVAQMSGGSAGQTEQGRMGGGMMGQGMMPGMMGQDQTQGQGMMGGSMMGPGMMPCMMMGQGKGQGMMGGGMPGPGMMPFMMMGQMMDGMMPAKARACMGMIGMMMTGCLDLPQMQKSLGLTPEQLDKLMAIQRPLQKESIRIGADIRVTELDLADLLSADKVDLGKVEDKLKERESLHTKIILAHLRASEEVKKIIPKEQLEKFQGMCQGCQTAPQPVQSKPPAESPQVKDPHHPDK